ncbi:hypothetical protein HDU76_000887, partial [Blyttiomyces sp. JEL0837]
MDFFFDMFNDEMERIRLMAIRCLKKICLSRQFYIGNEQLQNLLMALNDANVTMRYEIYTTIRSLRVKDVELLKALIIALQKNTIKFPDDRLRILMTFRYVAINHSKLIEILTPIFLQMDTRYLSKEFNLENKAHVSHIVMILNAALVSPAILKNLPRYVFRHFHFLLRKYRQLFAFDEPDISLQATSSVSASASSTPPRKPIQTSSSSSLLASSLKLNLSIQNMKIQDAPSLSGLIFDVCREKGAKKSVEFEREMKRLSMLMSEVKRRIKSQIQLDSDMMQFYYLLCLKSLLKIQKRSASWEAASCTDENHLIFWTYKAVADFAGIPKTLLNAFLQLRFCAYASLYLYDRSVQNRERLISATLDHITTIAPGLDEQNDTDGFYQSCRSLSKVFTQHNERLEIKAVQEFLQAFIPPQLPTLNGVRHRQGHAHISQDVIGELGSASSVDGRNQKLVTGTITHFQGSTGIVFELEDLSLRLVPLHRSQVRIVRPNTYSFSAKVPHGYGI